MGTISIYAHLRNSTDSIKRTKNMDMFGKKLSSSDVEALFTKELVEGAMETVVKVVGKVNS